MISSNQREVLAAVVVSIVLALYAAAFGYSIAQVWLAQGAHAPVYNEALLYIATALATLVGGIIVVLLNVPQTGPTPPAPAAPETPAPHGRDPQPRMKAPRAVMRMLSNLPAYLGIAYVVVYLCVGTVAVLTWLVLPGVTSDLVKNVATTFIGLAILIVRGYFNLRG